MNDETSQPQTSPDQGQPPASGPSRAGPPGLWTAELLELIGQAANEGMTAWLKNARRRLIRH